MATGINCVLLFPKRNANGKAIQAIATIRIISETKRKELNLFFEAEQAKREAKIKNSILTEYVS